MMDSKDLVNSAIRAAAGIYLQQINADNLYADNKENYNTDILKISELILLAGQINSIKSGLDEIRIYLAEISRK